MIDFFKSSRKSGGFSPWCKECHAEDQRERMAKRNYARTDAPTKVCPVCKVEKTTDEFASNKNRPDGLQGRCRSCHSHAWKRSTYKASLGKLNELFDTQGGRCAICESELDTSRYTKSCIDHDHKSGAVRGILCINCNSALGMMKDSPIRFRRAADYIEKHQCPNDIVSPPVATRGSFQCEAVGD